MNIQTLCSRLMCVSVLLWSLPAIALPPKTKGKPLTPPPAEKDTNPLERLKIPAPDEAPKSDEFWQLNGRIGTWITLDQQTRKTLLPIGPTGTLELSHGAQHGEGLVYSGALVGTFAQGELANLADAPFTVTTLHLNGGAGWSVALHPKVMVRAKTGLGPLLAMREIKGGFDESEFMLGWISHLGVSSLWRVSKHSRFEIDARLNLVLARLGVEELTPVVSISAGFGTIF